MGGLEGVVGMITRVIIPTGVSLPVTLTSIRISISITNRSGYLYATACSYTSATPTALDCWGTTASPTALVPPLHRSVLLGCPWIYRATAQSDSSRDCLCSLCHCWTAGSGGSAYASSPAPSLLLMDMELVLLIPERGTRYL